MIILGLRPVELQVVVPTTPPAEKKELSDADKTAMAAAEVLM